MTPNQQEEMLKKFNKWIYKNDTHCDLRDFEINHTYYKCKDSFDFAYTLQQEKIEKPEKVVRDQEKERQSSEAFWKRRLEIHQREIDSLKSDLDWITKKVTVVYEEFNRLNELVTYEKAKEIRQRHGFENE